MSRLSLSVTQLKVTLNRAGFRSLPAFPRWPPSRATLGSIARRTTPAGVTAIRHVPRNRWHPGDRGARGPRARAFHGYLLELGDDALSARRGRFLDGDGLYVHFEKISQDLAYLSSGKTYTPPSAIRDGQRRTIAVAELANTDIPWSEPRNLRWSKMSWQINDRTLPSISSHHPGGALAVFIDAHTQFLNNRTDPVALRALLTIAGREPVDPDDIPLR
jgi:hypothetical protein